MLQRDQETKELNSKQTVDHINQKIQQYKAQMEFSNKEKNQDNYFKRIAEELKSKTNKEPSKQDLLKAYLAQMKQDLINSFDQQESAKSGSSMVSTEDESFNV